MNALIKPRIFTEKVIIAIVGAVLTLSTSVVAYFTVKLNQKANIIYEKTEVNTAKIDTLHSTVNGKMRELLELTETAAKAEGKLEQIQKQDSIEEVKK